MGEKKYIRVERYKWEDERKQEKKYFLTCIRNILICALCFVLGFGACTLVNGVMRKDTNSQSKFGTIYNLMLNEWYFGKDIEHLDTYLINNAIYGLTTNEYDIHTNYMDEERTKAYLQKLEGSVVGIGITMTIVEETPMITRVFASSPAEDAGLKKGDIIVKVDGIAVKDKTLDEIANLTKGKEGTKVNYEVLRGNETIRVEMTRASVNTTVYGYEQEGVHVLDIDSISEHTDQEVEYYLMKYQKENVKDLIIDLRDNTGGYVDTVINICSMFVDKGKTVFYEMDKNDTTHEYKTKKSNVYTFDNIVILVNEGTASAAEVMASCLKHHLNVQLLGTKTYGKGTVQVSKQFSDGSYIKYTIAEWLSAGKDKINKVGITPDTISNLHPVLTHVMSTTMGSAKVDEVHALVKDVQLCLDFLGYNPGRMDGYYSNQTRQVLQAFENDYNLAIGDEINVEIRDMLLDKVSVKWLFEEESLDTQMKDAITKMKGN